MSDVTKDDVLDLVRRLGHDPDQALELSFTATTRGIEVELTMVQTRPRWERTVHTFILPDSP